MYIPEYEKYAGIPDSGDPYWQYDCAWCGAKHTTDTARDAHYRTCAARAVVLWAEAHATIKRLGGHGGPPRPTVLSGEPARGQILRVLRRHPPGCLVRDELIKTLQEMESPPVTEPASVLQSFMAFTG